MPSFAAVDLGASSGRVVLGRLDGGRLRLRELRRFRNGPVRRDGLRWNVHRLYCEVRTALDAAGDLAGVAVDSWAIDYGLLDADGELIDEPFSYRDGRSAPLIDAVHQRMAPAELYRRNGLQHLPFTTLYQLAADADSGRLDNAAQLLLIPDLIGYWLTGVTVAERTNASTTGLLHVHTGEWDAAVLATVGVPARLLPRLVSPGEALAPLGRAMLTAVGSHDTASAVVGVPAGDDRFAYISCGTWALVGVELDAPVLGEASRAANFTNECGVDGTVRYLRNVMGLWLLQELLRGWPDADLGALLAAAAELPPGGPLFDPDASQFLPPGDMQPRIEAACRASDQPVPAGRAALVRCVLDSLVAAFARAVRDAARLSGREIAVVHLVGGGARNPLLCQLTADACELPVLAGPVEATAIGNLAVQARTAGLVTGGLPELRAVVRASTEVRRYDPS